MKALRFRIAWIMVAVAIFAMALMPVVLYQQNARLEARAKARLADRLAKHWDSASIFPLRPRKTNKTNAAPREVFKEASNAVKAAIAPTFSTPPELRD